MADGDTHYRGWKAGSVSAITAAAGIAGLALYAGEPVLLVAAAATPAGYFLGRWLSPDLDLVGANSDESRMMRELKIIGALIFAWFSIYAYVMRFVGVGRKGHRNFFSHFPVISTTIRIAWLLLFPLISIPIYLIWKNGYSEYLLLPQVVFSVLGVICGLSLADTVHYMLDVTHKPRSRK